MIDHASPEPAALALLEREHHVWCAYPDLVAPEHAAEYYLPLLNQEERERYQRFHFDHDRHVYLAAHALLRLALSRYAVCAPAQWRFTRGPQGKPEIDAAESLPPLQFNLSHTRGLVACIITLDYACGIDVECMRPMKDLHGIAGMVFTDAEQAYLQARDPADLQHSFFTLWTLKEALIKATGQGISSGLKDLHFDIASSTVRATYSNAASAQTDQWHFQRWQPTATHRMAVATSAHAASRQLVLHTMSLEPTLTQQQLPYEHFRLPGNAFDNGIS